MAGTLKIYSDKLASYKKFYTIIKTLKSISLGKYTQTLPRAKTRDLSLRYTEKCFKIADYSEDALIAAAKKTTLLVPVSTNRGSCGALNSNTNRYVASILETAEQNGGKAVKIMAMHKRGNDSLSRLFPENFVRSIFHDFKTPLSFSYGSFVLANAADVVPEDKLERIEIIYSRFLTAGMQRQAVISIPAFPAWLEKIQECATSEKEKVNQSFANALLCHEEETIKDFYDFHSSLAMTHALLENELAESAARVVAVEGQLTNIMQLQQKFQYLYNKTRQSSITAALIEILSAMSSMEGNAAKGVKKKQFW